jgi:hypothetical protein
VGYRLGFDGVNGLEVVVSCVEKRPVVISQASNFLWGFLLEKIISNKITLLKLIELHTISWVNLR